MTENDARDDFAWMRSASAPPPSAPPWDAETRADLPVHPITEPAGFADTQTIRSRPRIVALVPAHNEEEDIGRTIASLLMQSRPIDEIVVIPNGCSDRTAQIARQYPVTVLELPRLEHKKSQALNLAWQKYARDADIIIGLDGDSELPWFAASYWEQEFAADPLLGGSSSQPVMTGNSFLSRLQRAEFTKTATIGLRRGGVSVISGTGCAFRGEALREAARLPGQEGPWSYESVVEDYYLTYQLRRLGWKCVMSPQVWCYTGSMKTVKSLWHQRIKWQVGTVHDLVRFGVNKLNWREWMTQVFGLLCIVFWVLWPALNVAEAFRGHLIANWTWAVFPVFFAVTEVIHTFKVRERDWLDFLIAGTMAGPMVMAFLSMGWVTVSWWKLVRGHTNDLWAAQYAAEGMRAQAAEEVAA